jgi:hypothetical protein
MLVRRGLTTGTKGREDLARNPFLWVTDGLVFGETFEFEIRIRSITVSHATYTYVTSWLEE